MDKKFYTDLIFFKKNGITQEYFANILSMSQPNLNAMLNGRIVYRRSKTGKLYDIAIQTEANKWNHSQQ